MQITLDVLRSKEGYIGTLASQSDLIKRRTPLFFSNPDIVSAQYEFSDYDEYYYDDA